MKIILNCNNDGKFSMPDHPLRNRNDDEGEWMDGRLLAHDVVEHVDGYQYIGTVEDELQALGAVWYTRGKWGDGVTDEGIIGDIIRNLQYVSHRLLYDSNIRPDIYEIGEFQYINEECKSIFFKEYDFGLDGNKNCKENLTKVLGWLVKGQRKAHKKYGRYGRFAANNLFNNIKREVDEIRYTASFMLYELQYCIKTQQARITEKHYQDNF